MTLANRGATGLSQFIYKLAIANFWFRVADATKLLLKEYVAPTQANIALFFLGPVITLIFGLLGYAALPYGPGLLINDMDLGIFFLLAVSSLATYGILMAGFFLFFFNKASHTNYAQEPKRSFSILVSENSNS